ncbi:hypothetical protein [Streptomyces mirabilis]|uniref:hypothetical protein n=1 Tax=Streptomyces mirabilis TaxID=68239 RepID=UPI0038284BF5
MNHLSSACPGALDLLCLLGLLGFACAGVWLLRHAETRLGGRRFSAPPETSPPPLRARLPETWRSDFDDITRHLRAARDDRERPTT